LVGIGDVVKELCEVTDGLGAKVIELFNHLFRRLVKNSRRRNWRGHICEEAAIFCRRQLELEVVFELSVDSLSLSCTKSLALSKIYIILRIQQAHPEATDKALNVAVLCIEVKHRCGAGPDVMIDPLSGKYSQFPIICPVVQIQIFFATIVPRIIVKAGIQHESEPATL
jgi:hypothetical protein